MTNPPASLGQRLLRRVKRLHARSAGDLDKFDCVRIELIRSPTVSRAVHRCVLEDASDYFADEIDKLRELQDSPQGRHSESNTLRLNVSAEIMDIVVEYLYTHEEPIEVSDRGAIELYAAARRFGLADLARRVSEFIRPNIRRWLNDRSIWQGLRYPDDIGLLAEIFEPMQFGNGDSGCQRTRCGTGCRVSSSTRSRTSDPRSQQRLRSVNASQAPIRSSEQRSSVAIVGRKQGHKGDERFIVSIHSTRQQQQQLWSGPLRYHSSSVIFHQYFYNVNFLDSGISVYSLGPRTSSRLVAGVDCEPLCRITAPDNDSIYGFRVFGSEVFFYTKSDIYALDGDGVNVKLIAHTDDALTSFFTILRRTTSEFGIAVQNIADREIIEMTFSRGSIRATGTRRLQSLPTNMWLIGSYEGLLYFELYEQKCCHYVAFRDGVEVKRRLLVESQRPLLCLTRIYNGVLYATYSTDASYACGIDLHSDAVIFRKSDVDLGLEYVSGIIPMIRTDSVSSVDTRSGRHL